MANWCKQTLESFFCGYRIYRSLSVALALVAGAGLSGDLFGDDETALHDISLYYLLGGGRATDAAASPFDRDRSLLGGAAHGGSTCGAFSRSGDVLDMLSARLEDSLTSLVSVPETVASALPGTILCRAKPGLCQLLQHYVVRAENRWNLSVDACRRDVEASARGGAPHLDILETSRVQVWEHQARQGESAETARLKAEATDGCVTWLGGRRAGCRSADPIWLMRDTASAGWCLLMNQPGDCQRVQANTGSDSPVPLAQAWESSQDAGAWVASVLGDYRLQAGTTVETRTGGGLLPIIDQQTEMLKKQLTQRVYRPGSEDTRGAIALDGTDVVLTPALINALRDLPDRDYLIARLANEAALADVVGKAFLARRLLLSGLMEPHIQRTGGIAETVRRQVAVLEHEIDRATWEMQARRHIVAGSVLEVLAAHRAQMTPGAPQSPAVLQRLR